MAFRNRTKPDESVIPEDAPDSAAVTPPEPEPELEPGALTLTDPEPVAEPEPGADSDPVADPAAAPPAPSVMIPARSSRSVIESFFMRLVATGGVVAIGTAVAAIMGSQKAQSWIIGLVVSVVTLLVAAILWSSQRL